MARFITTVESSLQPAEAFDLLAHFESVAEWDPGITEAERLDEGELRVGSAFLVTAAFGPRRLPLTYVVRELEPGERVVLEAVSHEIVSHDVISVHPGPQGSTVTYDATVTLQGWRKLGEPGLRAAFGVFGGRAEAGLRTALNPVPAQA